MRSARHRARAAAMQGLYEWLVAEGDPELIGHEIRTGSHWSKIDQEYFSTLWQGVMEHAAALQIAIEPQLDRAWPEVSPVERAILLLGAFELQHRVEIPYRVVLNEAVELAKTYGGTDGHKFINGVLDQLAKGVRAAERA
ncbi:MAG: transcription antitermination factor NusB [Betaproteobacteria bacterium]|nr:transcription antitermination factor NusB [Betaproteobacteria bacterium]